MNLPLLNRLTIFVVPVLVLVSVQLAGRLQVIPPYQAGTVALLPWVALVVAALLAIHFKRGRPIVVILLVAIAYRCYELFLAQPGHVTAADVLSTLAFLVPFNLFLLTFMRERWILSPGGQKRLFFLLFQLLLAAWCIRRGLPDISPVVAQGGYLYTPVIPVKAIWLAIFLAIPMTVRVVTRQSPLESAFLGVFIAMSAALAWRQSPHVVAAFVTAAALILFLAILQDSYNMAFCDELTGIPGRRALNEQLMSLSRPYVIAMVDVDHFKQFNDTHGHDVGDQVLRIVAAKLKEVSGGGRSFRYGGEEFAVVFPKRRAHEVMSHLESLRKAIAGHEICIRSADRPKGDEEGKNRRRGEGCGNGQVTVTVSIGVAESNDRISRADEVIKLADQALYKAKNHGRNQVWG
ncbi:MAG TPA: GGDEF domain-containing protein [Geobacterales bacterium]|nr:GGDEF domain-containing protein [Geobacterales bacterium]